MLDKSVLHVHPFALKETGRIIGFVILITPRKNASESKSDIFIKQPLEKGFAHEILDTGNAASEKVLQMCGFIQEGVLRDKYLVNGKYNDDIVYSITN